MTYRVYLRKLEHGNTNGRKTIFINTMLNVLKEKRSNKQRKKKIYCVTMLLKDVIILRTVVEIK